MKNLWLLLISLSVAGPLCSGEPTPRAEIKGKVTAVSGRTVQIQIEGNTCPSSGDSVELSFEVPDVGAVPMEGVWRVTAVSGQVVTAGREGAESAKPQAGYHMRLAAVGEDGARRR